MRIQSDVQTVVHHVRSERVAKNLNVAGSASGTDGSRICAPSKLVQQPHCAERNVHGEPIWSPYWSSSQLRQHILSKSRLFERILWPLLSTQLHQLCQQPSCCSRPAGAGTEPSSFFLRSCTQLIWFVQSDEQPAWPRRCAS